MNKSTISSWILGLLLYCLTLAYPVRAKELIWYNGQSAITYHIHGKIDAVSKTALTMWQEDMNVVTGKSPILTDSRTAAIHIVQLNKGQARQWRNKGIPTDTLLTLKDAFCIKVIDDKKSGKHIYVVGSDDRGTAYGILELSRMAGVSPWIWWGDVTPDPKERLTIADNFFTLQSPDVEYRGIFLNDEDWTLQPWSWQTFEPSPIKGRIGAKTYKEIFKLLMRLRANAIWPGMHGITTPFYFVPGAKEAAAECGIVIGTSHCEPLGRNNVGEWKEDDSVEANPQRQNLPRRGEYNYITNKTAVQEYWIERLQEAGSYENIYTIGMRGVHDGAMEGVKGTKNSVKALQEVIDDQRELLKKYVRKDITSIPQQFVPYKEVLEIMESGLNIPEDVTLTWCDDNYGYMTRLSDSLQQKRSGGAGVYYHLSYWGRPHDYMWLTTHQPGLIYNEMKAAYDHNARKLWIVNVHDLKPAAYDLELFLDMAWDIESVSPSTLCNHLEQWLCREFGEEAGRKLLPVMQEYYRLTAIRKPEFMGWSQVELDKKVYIRGWSPLINTEFSLTEFGGELDRYLGDYAKIVKQVNEIKQLIPAHRRDAYFSAIEYQVKGADAMARKILESQRARQTFQNVVDTTLWIRDEIVRSAEVRAIQAYKEIQSLTNYYNNDMAQGKWKGSMCYNPRDLYVFYPPLVPVWPTDVEMEKYSNIAPPQCDEQYLKTDIQNVIVRNAATYNSASCSLDKVQMLGHSMLAVPLPKGASVSYEFESLQEGEATLTSALIPTQPNDKGDIRFSVSIDGGTPIVISLKEKFRSSQWKLNVLRAQALKKSKIHLSKGKHVITFTALDEHIILDQWMIDFVKDRKFYVFPIKSEI